MKWFYAILIADFLGLFAYSLFTDNGSLELASSVCALVSTFAFAECNSKERYRDDLEESLSRLESMSSNWQETIDIAQRAIDGNKEIIELNDKLNRMNKSMFEERGMFQEITFGLLNDRMSKEEASGRIEKWLQEREGTEIK